MLDREECYEWMKDCYKFDDLFLQNGHWNTIHIATQCQERRFGTVFHSIDAWITSISPEFEAEQLNGIMEMTWFTELYPGSKQM